MRIGIITQPLAHNYGGILQNYALQQVLLCMGHTPLTIDFLPSSHLGRRIKHIIWSYIHLRKPNKWLLPHKRPRFSKKFIQQNISTTSRVKRYRANIIKSYKFNVVIAGSDQIWRPSFNDCLFDMFFYFLCCVPIRKIVYAASFGTDEREYTLQEIERCRPLAQQIEAVSVREKSGVELCRYYFDIAAQWVLDPTMLLESSDYERLCTSVPCSENAFMAVYMLDIDERILDNIESIAKELEVEVKVFSAEQDATLSIEGWLAMFRDAKYVITDSFHGTVFSIIFNKSFLSIGNKKRGMSRFHSLLGQFGLDCRLSQDITIEKLLRPIPWEEINRQKQELKNKSILFLETSLQGDTWSA